MAKKSISSPDTERMIEHHQYYRDLANRIAGNLEKLGYEGFYIRPDNTTGKLDPQTRPTRFSWAKK